MAIDYSFRQSFTVGDYTFNPAMDYSTNQMGVRIVNNRGTALPMDVVSKSYALAFLNSIKPRPVVEKIAEPIAESGFGPKVVDGTRVKIQTAKESPIK